MKRKYITLNIMMACAKKSVHRKKSIHEQIEQTIVERKRILHQLQKYTQTARTVEMILANTQAA